MASGFFAILDDIAALMDDVAVTTKVATAKTAGILGDDLAVNAEKATGFIASRELPVLWAISKGSLLNKLIIIPVALLLNVFLPVAIKAILVLGGCYLAFEGVEKIFEFLFHRQPKTTGKTKPAEPAGDEKAKVKSAIATDFILSIEIVIIALGTVLDKPLTVQIVTVLIVALLATIGVYGIVALIVRMDDAGYQLIRKSANRGFLNLLGKALVRALPFIIKVLAVTGTFALLLVAGGIFSHNIGYVHHLLPGLPSPVKDFALGLLAGIVCLALVAGSRKIFARSGTTGHA